MPAAPDRDDRRVVADAIRANRPCLLCAGPPAAFAVWGVDPATRRLLNAPASAPLRVGYGLCAACLATPDVTARVETKILSDLAANQ